MRKKHSIRWAVCSSLMLFSLACAGKSQPTPETPASQPAATESGGEHTMPDGTKMQGHKHDDASEQSMPNTRPGGEHDHGGSESHER